MLLNSVYSIYYEDDSIAFMGNLEQMKTWINQEEIQNLNLIGKLVRFQYRSNLTNKNTTRLIKVTKIFKKGHEHYLEGKDLFDNDHYKVFKAEKINQLEIVS